MSRVFSAIALIANNGKNNYTKYKNIVNYLYLVILDLREIVLKSQL